MISSKITAKSVNRDSLPTQQQARDVMHNFYDIVWPIAYPPSDLGKHKLHLDLWANSTVVNGVREIRVRVLWAQSQEIVDQTIGTFLDFVQGKLPAGSYLVYTHAWRVRNSFKFRNNCAKVYYRSSMGKHAS